MFNHVIVPLDRSELAETALSYARKLVKPGGQLTLISVIEHNDLTASGGLSPSGTVGTGSATISGPGVPTAPPLMLTGKEAQVKSREKLEDYLKQVVYRLQEPGLTVDYSIQEGKAADVIVDEAESLRADVIVMSTHGRSGLSRWLLGSVTQKVVGAAPCPVLAIPNRQLKG